MLVGAAAAAPSALAAGPSPVVVSLTFDDGDATQSAAATTLAAHGMKGTFFINSGLIGTTGHFTWGQLNGLAADGNEIGGHTYDHANLTTLTTQELQWEVCEDRARLLNHGFPVTDFAYPYGVGAGSPTVVSTLQQCGYNSARRSWGLAGSGCPTCTDYAETIPPRNYYGLATADAPTSDTTLANLESYVTNAQNNGGGWVIFVFHDICDACSTYSTSQATLQGLMDFLQQQATNSLAVKTVNQVIGGTVKASPGTADAVAPTSSISCNSGSCSTSAYTAPAQVALAATDMGGSGLDAVRYTTDGSTPTLASAVYTGPFTVSTTTTVKYRAWDNAGNVEATNSQLIAVDTTPPTSAIACNGAACSSSTYTAAVSVSLSATDPDDAVAAIRYTTDGSAPTASSTLYTGAFTVSTTTTVKYRGWDTAGNVEATKSQLIQVDTFAPTVSITAPANGATVTGNVKITAAPADAQTGVASVAFYVDGVLVGTTTSSPWQLPWNTKKVSSGQHVLTAVATDRAGNRTTSVAVTIAVR
jgi:peptidoglycan/xylan/chitin deacetylase (PgdA/CDA1 family)